jgi:hypothetical protein
VVSKTIQEWDGSETSLLPEWMVRSIDRGYGVNDRGEPVAETPKIGFHLLRHPASDMQQMQQGKLNAPQILRARKVLSYAVSKLNLEIPPHMQRPGLDKAVDYLELLCQDELVPPGPLRRHSLAPPFSSPLLVRLPQPVPTGAIIRARVFSMVTMLRHGERHRMRSA